MPRRRNSSLIARCMDAGCAGKPFVEQLKPGGEDYFALKPMHSAFFQTPVEILLEHRNATSLILTGLGTNSCIICTAYDAKIRSFRLFVPSDCAWTDCEAKAGRYITLFR